jgi:hypothetical protein
MATLFEARPRFTFRHDAAASADVVATISRSMRRELRQTRSTPHRTSG